MEKVKKNRRLTGSTPAKIAAYFLLVISFVVCGAGAFCTALLYGNGYKSRDELIDDMMYEIVCRDFDVAEDTYFYGKGLDSLEYYFSEKNAELEIYVDDKKVWSCYDGEETPYYHTRYGTAPAGSFQYVGKDKYEFVRTEEYDKKNDFSEYTMYLYVDKDFPYEDEYKIRAEYGEGIYELFYGTEYLVPFIIIAGILIFFISFIFLMCSAGHKNGREGIQPGVLTELPLDLLSLAFGTVALVGVVLFFGALNYSPALACIAVLFIVPLEIVWCTMYCMEFALRLKLGKFWRNTLIYRLLRLIFRAVRWLFCSLVTLIRGIPLVINTIIVFLAICILEFMGILIFCDVEVFLLWCLEKMILLPLILYVALMCRKLQQGSEALAEGNLSYYVDTSKMILDFKEHGENLNCIGEGISKAVEERMRSEHLKTELITNVSHDLKTPLTSIINYADLIGSEKLENEKVTEYAEVLLRQSKRLKKLLEDLVEASKATTGNLEVNLVPCEIGVLLSQAVGEYEQRFAEKNLELITRQPEEQVYIQADGRHLWRIFDNLLNNIYKYAQDNTRVYLSVEVKENTAEIIFRNMSKYALDILPKELEERFVRGDKSRHMEGNGLGLSIARSLVDLQNGAMELVTDGDLFKVILRFSILKKGE